MKFSEFDTDATTLIEAYEHDRVRIAGRDYTGGVLVSAEGITAGWGPDSPADLAAEHLEPLLEAAPQVVVLGTGRRQKFPDPAVYFALLEQGIGVEIMDTGAACRTYNILAGEGRRVVAALLLN
jgi:uncharacterized protein